MRRAFETSSNRQWTAESYSIQYRFDPLKVYKQTSVHNQLES